MDYEFIRIEHEGPISRLILNRPEAMNALNTGIMEEIEHASRHFLENEICRVVEDRVHPGHVSLGLHRTVFMIFHPYPHTVVGLAAEKNPVGVETGRGVKVGKIGWPQFVPSLFQ